MYFWLFAWLVALFWFCGFCLFWWGGFSQEKLEGRRREWKLTHSEYSNIWQKHQQKSRWKIVIQMILTISDHDIASAATVAT